MSKQDIFDITIIGGGPAGLFSAFYSGLRGMKTKIIEYQGQLGGKVHVYPEKIVWDVGGLPPLAGEQLIQQLVAQGLTFKPDVCLNTQIDRIDKNAEGLFTLHTQQGQVHYSKTVIVAVGGGILNPQKINIEGAENYEVTNLHYTVGALSQFKNKNVIISGGGNSAIDWAHELEPIAKHVFIACRKDHLTCHERQAETLQDSSVICFFNSKIKQFISSIDGRHIEKVILENQVDQSRHALPIDHVIVNHGYVIDTSLLDQTPLDIKRIDNYFIAGESDSRSSVAGLYAAGDILMHDGKLNLIAGAFQDAANAVNSAKQWLEPSSTRLAMVSSHNEAFKTKNEAIRKSLFQNK